MKISQEFSRVVGEEKLWVYGAHDRRGRKVAWLRHESLEKEILSLLTRRPCRAIDVSKSLGISLGMAEEKLKHLKKRGLVDARMIEGESFFVDKNSPSVRKE